MSGEDLSDELAPLLSAARLHESRGEWAAALEILERLVASGDGAARRGAAAAAGRIAATVRGAPALLARARSLAWSQAEAASAPPSPARRSSKDSASDAI